MIITTGGTLIRMSMDGISTMGRYAQGVKLINIREEDAVSTVCRTDKSEEEEDETAQSDETAGGNLELNEAPEVNGSDAADSDPEDSGETLE